MAIAVAVIATLFIVGWIVFRAVRQKPVKAHMVSRGVAYVAGLYTFAFFLTMGSIPQLVKIAASILLGAVLIVIAATLQKRRHHG